MVEPVTSSFPEPTDAIGTRAQVLTRYLDFFRDRVVEKVASLPDGEARTSRLPSGWAPVDLVRHLTFVELRWLDWGFAGDEVDDPWGDEREGVWFVGPEESTADVLQALRDRTARTDAVVAAHDLADVGRPGPRWRGADPATLERVLLHLVQEYARHLGQLDVVTELAGGHTGE